MSVLVIAAAVRIFAPILMDHLNAVVGRGYTLGSNGRVCNGKHPPNFFSYVTEITTTCIFQISMNVLMMTHTSVNMSVATLRGRIGAAAIVGTCSLMTEGRVYVVAIVAITIDGSSGQMKHKYIAISFSRNCHMLRRSVPVLDINKRIVHRGQLQRTI